MLVYGHALLMLNDKAPPIDCQVLIALRVIAHHTWQGWHLSTESIHIRTIQAHIYSIATICAVRLYNSDCNTCAGTGYALRYLRTCAPKHATPRGIWYHLVLGIKWYWSNYYLILDTK